MDSRVHFKNGSANLLHRLEEDTAVLQTEARFIQALHLLHWIGAHIGQVLPEPVRQSGCRTLCRAISKSPLRHDRHPPSTL